MVKYIFLFLSMPLVAQWQWPLKDPQVVQNFTENVMLLRSSSLKVYSLTSGNIAYMAKKNPFSEMSSPLGEYILLVHDNNFYSFYAGIHLSNIEDIGVSGEIVIGQVKREGFTYQPLLLFGILDETKNKWINPRLVLPVLPEPRPVNMHLIPLRNGGRNGLAIVLRNRFTQATGIAPYKVFIKIDDVVFKNQYDSALFSMGNPRLLRSSQILFFDTSRIVLIQGKELTVSMWNFAGKKSIFKQILYK